MILRTQHTNTTHMKTPIERRPPITQITPKQQMHVSRWVGKADFATGSHRDTQTYFYILPLTVNCVFAYNIFVLDVIRLVVNIGQYHRRRMHADIHTCMGTDMHTYIHKYSCCFFPGCGKRPITYKADKLSRAQQVMNSQNSDRGNIVSYQLSSTFDSRHRDCANKHSPNLRRGTTLLEWTCVYLNIGIHTQCAMAQWKTERDKYTAFALTILITKCRVQTGHVLILAVIRIARNWFTSGWAPPPSE